MEFFNSSLQREKPDYFDYLFLWSGKWQISSGVCFFFFCLASNYELNGAQSSISQTVMHFQIWFKNMKSTTWNSAFQNALKWCGAAYLRITFWKRQGLRFLSKIFLNVQTMWSEYFEGEISHQLMKNIVRGVRVCACV